MLTQKAVCQCSLPLVLFLVQGLFLILYAVYGDYKYLEISSTNVSRSYGEHEVSAAFYPMFQDVHVMMFIGFGFLMTFLKKYGVGAVSLNFVIAALVLQWYMILISYFETIGKETHIHITMRRLIFSDFAAASVLISFGAVIGKMSPYQFIIMAMLEIVFFCINEWIALHYFKAKDIGGSMIVHTFGAYFGMAVAWVTVSKDQRNNENEGARYDSDIFSMIGTIFLWMFWPSFNSAIADSEVLLQRSVMNTYLSLAACVLISFAVSSMVTKHGKLNMVHIQNATLAGGVAVGTSANLLLHPWGAILIGMIAACLSVVGFRYIQPFLTNKLRLHDTCGVHNLHGMPGVMAGIISAIIIATSTVDEHNANSKGSFATLFPEVQIGDRTLNEQAGFQIATLAVSIGIGLVGGALTGLIIRALPWKPRGEDIFKETMFFELEEAEAPAYEKPETASHLNTMASITANNGVQAGLPTTGESQMQQAAVDNHAYVSQENTSL